MKNADTMHGHLGCVNVMSLLRCDVLQVTSGYVLARVLPTGPRLVKSL